MTSLTAEKEMILSAAAQEMTRFLAAQAMIPITSMLTTATIQFTTPKDAAHLCSAMS